MSAATMLTRNVARLLVPGRKLIFRAPHPHGDVPPVFLTFDDGPDPDHTPRVLDCLDRLGVRATFFVLGPKALAQKPIIRRILAAGHTIGAHGWNHVRASQTAPADWLADADRGIAALQDITGEKCRLFRPAYGEMTPRGLLGLLQRKQQIVLWTQDVRDYAARSGDDLANWFQTSQPLAGSIVLMHDNLELTGLHLERCLACWRDSVSFERLASPDRAGGS